MKKISILLIAVVVAVTMTSCMSTAMPGSSGLAGHPDAEILGSISFEMKSFTFDSSQDVYTMALDKARQQFGSDVEIEIISITNTNPYLLSPLLWKQFVNARVIKINTMMDDDKMMKDEG